MCWTWTSLAVFAFVGLLSSTGLGTPGDQDPPSLAGGPAEAETGLPEPAASPLRVMSFNLRYGTAEDGEDSWGLRRDRLVASIRAFTPDILGTQECLAAQKEFLTQALPGYGSIGVGRDDGKLGGEMCAIFYRKDRLVKLAEGHFWLSEAPNVPGSSSWDAALTRMVTWARFRDERQPKLDCWLFNTHFDHVGALARLRSAQALRDSIAARTGFIRTIVTGDFNTPADTAETSPYYLLTSDQERPERRLIDVYRVRHAPGPDEGTYHGFTGRSSDGARVDWILVTPDLVPLQAQIDRRLQDGRYPSDHFPITAAVGLPTRR